MSALAFAVINTIAVIIGAVLFVAIWMIIADAVHDEIDVNPSSVPIIALLILFTFIAIVIHLGNVIGINI